MSSYNFLNEWRWNSMMASRLRFPNKDIELLTENYSQAFQDIFLIMMLDGKKNGRYLEIGGHVPINNNNTYLVDRYFGWTGLTLELDASHYPLWLKSRPDSHFLIADALNFDYSEALKLTFSENTGRIDYLQLDIDPSINTLNVLKRLPLKHWRFSIITFETDAYQGDFRARDESRKILSEHGYILIAKDVSVLFSPISQLPIPFEDWWVDPQIFDKKIIDEIQLANSKNSQPQSLILLNNES